MFSAPELFAVGGNDPKKSGMKRIKAECSGFKRGPRARKRLDPGTEST